jgi:hypothetical protein
VETTKDDATVRTGEGQIVPDELRPVKSGTLYGHKEVADKTGRVSPHMLPQPYGPVNGKGGEDLSGPYEVIEGWPDAVEPGWRLSGPSGCWIDSPDRVVVISHFGMVQDRLTPLVWGRNVFAMEGSPYRTYGTLEGRAENFVVTFNREGHVIDSWKQNDKYFRKINRIFVDPADPDRHIWITDSKKQTIYKFTNDGRELVMTVTEAQANSVPGNPWKAEDIAWLPNGDFYTAGLGRIDRFTADGKLIWSRLTRGSEPGEFLDLHGLVLDGDRKRIYVSDRGNSRIQVFDEEWNLIDLWPNIYAPYALRMEVGGDIWVADGFTSKFLHYNPDGKLIASWGQFGIAPGATWGVHWFDRDDEGNVYVCEVYGERVQKFRPRADVPADDPRLIGPLHRY